MTAMPAASPVTTGHVFRPRSSYGAAITWGLVTAAWIWLAVDNDGVAGLVQQVPAIAFAASGVYGVLVRPSVEVSGSGVRLRNVVRDVEVPWAALAEVRTRYALTLVTTDGRSFSAWAAPASGRHTDTSLTDRDVRALGWGARGDLPPTSASPASSSGAVAAWVRREWRRAIDPSGDGAGSAGAEDAWDADSAQSVSGSPSDAGVVAPAVRTRLAVGVITALATSSALVLLTFLL